MDEIEKRLRDTTEACIRNFENWIKEKKSTESRESLMETMHEVRKVLSRVEIEIAISERDRLGARPIPIPPHRSSRKRSSEGDDISDYSDDETPDFDQPQPVSNASEPRRPPSGGGQGRGRRPMPNRDRGNADRNGNNNNGGGDQS